MMQNNNDKKVNIEEIEGEKVTEQKGEEQIFYVGRKLKYKISSGKENWFISKIEGNKIQIRSLCLQYNSYNYPISYFKGLITQKKVRLMKSKVGRTKYLSVKQEEEIKLLSILTYDGIYSIKNMLLCGAKRTDFELLGLSKLNSLYTAFEELMNIIFPKKVERNKPNPEIYPAYDLGESEVNNNTCKINLTNEKITKDYKNNPHQLLLNKLGSSSFLRIKNNRPTTEDLFEYRLQTIDLGGDWLYLINVLQDKSIRMRVENAVSNQIKDIIWFRKINFIKILEPIGKSQEILRIKDFMPNEQMYYDTS